MQKRKILSEYIRPTNSQRLLGSFVNVGQKMSLDDLRQKCGLRGNAFSGTISCLIGLKRLARIKIDGVVYYEKLT